MPKKYTNTVPRMISAKFNSKCAETGKVILAGEPCLFYPEYRRVYHVDSQMAQNWREMQADKEQGYEY